MDEEKEFLQRIVHEPWLQQKLFIEWACSFGGISVTASGGEIQNSGNNGKLCLPLMCVVHLITIKNNF